MPPEPDGSFFHLLGTLPTAAAQYDSNAFFSILLLIALVLVNAFFAASEIAIITLNDNKIRKMAEDGNKRAAKIVKLTTNTSRFFATIQVGVTLSGFLTSASASQSFSGKLAGTLSFLPVSQSVIYGVSTVLITLLLSYFSLVFGELVPKKIAMQRAEQLSFKFIGILDATSVAFRPFITFLTFSTNVVLKMLGFDPNSMEEAVTEEEILMMVDAGEEKGVFGVTARDMISNIFDFNDISASEIMTHRTDVGAIEGTASVQDVVNLSIEKGYSRIPVYQEDLDNVLGVIYVKDLLKYVGSEVNQTIRITDLMRPAYFVPGSKRCSALFKEMTDCRTQIAIVVDEYGGTDGIITMEDLLESIVGNIQDEYDNEEEEIHKEADNKFTVDGGTSIDEISDLVGVDIPEGDYDTIAGFVVEILGRIPKPNENPSVTIKNLTLTVQEVEDRRISKILIIKMPEANEPKEQRPAKST